MNVLILSNGAPGYHNFFNSLALRLSEDGAKVFFAVDCETSRDENKLNELPFENFEFSSFFASHTIDQEILSRYSGFNLNSALLSDYERAVVYRIWKNPTIEFYEKLKSALLSFFEKIIKEKAISVVVYENVSNAFAHFAWFACQAHGIRYVGVSSSRLPGRFMISDDPLGDHVKIEETLKKIAKGEITITEEAKSWCGSYLSNLETIVPDYMKYNNLEKTGIIEKYLKTEKLKKLKTALRHIGDDHIHSFQRGNPVSLSWQMFKRSLFRKLRINRIKKFYSTHSESDEFFLYPLHYHPESSTSILSGAYVNELEVIRNISFNLPQGTMLYVKDHISAFGYPNKNFYREVSFLPNTKIIHPTAPTKKLIRQSKAVITLTSTVGYEAALLNKRVFLFGSVFYQEHINVTKIENPRKIYEYLKDVPPPETNKEIEYNQKFLAAYYINTQAGGLNLMKKTSLDDEKNSSIVRRLAEIIRSQKFNKASQS